MLAVMKLWFNISIKLNKKKDKYIYDRYLIDNKIQNIRNISKEYLHKDVNHFKPKDEYLTYSYAYPST